MACYCDNCIFEDNPNAIYEIHITVSDADSSAFLDTCKQNDINTVVIDNIVNIHVMTAQPVEGGFYKMLSELHRIQDILSDYEILRTKIETNKANYGVVQYTETHMSFNTLDELLLNELLEIPELLVSKTNKKIIATTRNVQNHEQVLEDILSRLPRAPDKLITEFCIFDNNEYLDSYWIAEQNNKEYS
jgi:hypothetical protein